MRYAISVLTGQTKLPSKEQMKEWIRDDLEYRKKNLPSKKMHYLGSEQWNYLKLLATLGNFSVSDVPPVIEKLYSFCHEIRGKNYLTYREINFKIIDENNFTVIY